MPGFRQHVKVGDGVERNAAAEGLTIALLSLKIQEETEGGGNSAEDSTSNGETICQGDLQPNTASKKYKKKKKKGNAKLDTGEEDDINVDSEARADDATMKMTANSKKSKVKSREQVVEYAPPLASKPRSYLPVEVEEEEEEEEEGPGRKKSKKSKKQKGHVVKKKMEERYGGLKRSKPTKPLRAKERFLEEFVRSRDRAPGPESGEKNDTLVSEEEVGETDTKDKPQGASLGAEDESKCPSAPLSAEEEPGSTPRGDAGSKAEERRLLRQTALKAWAALSEAEREARAAGDEEALAAYKTEFAQWEEWNALRQHKLKTHRQR